MKKMIEQFNQENNLLVLTTYPNPLDERKGRREFSAIAWHSRKTLRHLCKFTKILVLAEDREKKTFRDNKNLLVLRKWKKGSVFSILSLLPYILKLKNKSIFVQFEFNVFGGILTNIALIFTLFILKLLGKNIFFELHQVLEDIKLLEKHINIKNKIKQKFFNLGLKAFYLFLGLSVNKIIVFEEELKRRLSKYVNKEKIEVFSLSVDSKKALDKNEARRKIGLSRKEFVILCFGFINGYKGLDWIIRQFRIKNSELRIKNVRLVIAGGENPYLKDMPHYQKFYNSIISEAKKCKQITYTGFVPDNKVSSYFSACDLAVLPYEVFMSASGPFSLSLSYSKPVILSDVLSSYALSKDFKKSLIESGLEQKDIFFNLKGDSFANFLLRIKNSKVYMEKLTHFSKTLAMYRSSNIVIFELFRLISSFNLRCFLFWGRLVKNSNLGYNKISSKIV